MILFCDIDGVLLPARAYFLPNQTKPIPTIFDPCVVGMVNRLCADFGAKIVIHSNWRGTEPRRIRVGLGSLPEHFTDQGFLPEHLHADPMCPRKFTSTRWHDIGLWLEDHPEETQFYVLEDTQCPPGWQWENRVIQTDFDHGLTVEQYLELRTRMAQDLGLQESKLILP